MVPVYLQAISETDDLQVLNIMPECTKKHHRSYLKTYLQQRLPFYSCSGVGYFYLFGYNERKYCKPSTNNL